MFRKALMIVPLAMTLVLGSCGTVPNPAPGQIFSDAQKFAVTICGFLPTIATVTDIFLSGNPLYQTAESIGKAICAAVAPTQLALREGRRMAVAPMVGGIVIHGRFVR